MHRRILLSWLLLLCALLTPALSHGAPVPCASYICIEADSGLTITESNAGEVREPASMVKSMLMLLVAEGLDRGDWTLEDPITVSRHAESMGGSQVYLKEGETWTLAELMDAVAVASANDAAMAVAEGLWGSEEQYLDEANARAQELGMVDTVFCSVHGLPPEAGEEPDQMTARDMAVLAQWCVRHPQIITWVNRQELQFRPDEAVKYNTNKLLWHMTDCDGLKTGYTRAAGWCLTATAMRGDIRLIAVAMGCERRNDRFLFAEDLLDSGFQKVERKRLVARGQPIEPETSVLNCEIPAIRLTAAEDFSTVVLSDEPNTVQLVFEAPEALEAPLEKDAVVGKLYVQRDGQEIGQVPLVTPNHLPAAGWRWKLTRGALPRLAR
jgi:serine-type D-Ala-D-Ala carboxypeptidase (penicillin-binding protein 5/6)